MQFDSETLHRTYARRVRVPDVWEPQVGQRRIQVEEKLVLSLVE